MDSSKRLFVIGGLAASAGILLPKQLGESERQNTLPPGALEAEVKSPFITKNGHLDFLQELAHLPPIKTTNSVYVNWLLNNPKKRTLQEHLYYLSALHKTSLSNEHPDYKTDPEAIHRAIVSLATIVSNKTSIPEFNSRFNTHISKDIKPFDFYNFEKGFITINSPLVPPYIVNRPDWGMHIVQHLFLAHQTIYGIENKLPFIPKPFLNFPPEPTAKSLSLFIGSGYEVISTFTPEGLGLKPNMEDTLRNWVGDIDIDTGIFDPEVKSDLKANYIGAGLGVDISKVPNIARLIATIEEQAPYLYNFYDTYPFNH